MSDSEERMQPLYRGINANNPSASSKSEALTGTGYFARILKN
jgi:hypothetical protein